MLPSRARRRITAASAKLLTRYVEFPKKSVANDPIRLGGGVRCSDAFGDLVVYGLSVRMDAPSGVGIGAFLFFRRPYRRESIPYDSVPAEWNLANFMAKLNHNGERAREHLRNIDATET